MRRPHITLKLATSLDGKIALANGQSEWITGEAARAAGRRLRGEHDGIMIGANTAVLDNPQLTTRIQDQPNPVRIVFDTKLRTPAESNLAQTARDTPVIIFHDAAAGPNILSRKKVLTDLGVQVLALNATVNGLDIVTALDVLARQGLTRLLLEGGGTLSASFMRAQCIDVIEWFRAPMILGGDARDGIGALGFKNLDLCESFERIYIKELGRDIHEKYTVKPRG